MKNRFIPSVFFVVTAVCSMPVCAQPDAQIELSKSSPSYTNTSNIAVGNGAYGVWVNGIDGFSGTFLNSGSITTTGSGIGIYSSSYLTRPVSVYVGNTGTIQRIQLEETTDSILYNGSAGRKETNGNSALNTLVQGYVLMGPDSLIVNYDGTFENLSADEELAKGNLIALSANSSINNGVETVYSVDDGGNRYLADVIFHDSKITTDRIQYAASGSLINGHIVDNKSIVFGDGGSIYNIGDAYSQTTIGTTNSNGSTITTEKIVMGKGSWISNEMGTNLNANEVKMGDNSEIINGSNYSLVYKKELIVEETDEEGEKNETAYPFPTMPQSGSMNIKNLTFENNGTLKNNPFAKYTGESISFESNGKVENVGGSINLSKEEGESVLSFGDGGTLILDSYAQDAVSVPKLKAETSSEESSSADDTVESVSVEMEEILPQQKLYAELTVDKIVMGNNGTINNVMGKITADSITMADYGKIHTFSPNVKINEGIYFGNNGTLENITDEVNEEDSNPPIATIETDVISFQNFGTLINGSVEYTALIRASDTMFKDDGHVVNYGLFDSKTLTMENRGTVDLYRGDLTARTTLGSDSVVNLLSLNEGGGQGGAVTGGVYKAEGAQNVQIISDTETGYYGYVTGGVDVDSILINRNELHISGDVKGQINMNSDTVLKLVDSQVVIHDPILKMQDTENTTIDVALTGDNAFFTTNNNINVDHIVLSSGGMEVTRPISVNDISLNDDTTLRLKGDFITTGEIKEVGNDSANTTLSIDAGTGNAINTKGTIVLDRVAIESGVLNAYHTIKADYSDDASTMPSAHEQGVELGSDTVFNVHADSSVNRIARLQDVLAQGEDINNTTVNVNHAKLKVDRFVDLDNLNLNHGMFSFLNKDAQNAVNITNDVNVNAYSTFSGNGLVNIKSGKINIGENARLAVSLDDVDGKNIDTMTIVKSPDTITDATLSYQKENATLNLNEGSYLDLRADSDTNDKIKVEGTVNIAEGTRVVLRNIQTNTEYELLSATQLNGNVEKIKTSFLWAGASFNKKDNALFLKITGVQTLEEGLADASHSDNVTTITKALEEIKSVSSANTIDPFLDNVYFADSASDAVQVMDEYSPEGYLNLQQAAVRLNRGFKESAISELTDMRTRKHEIQPQQMRGHYGYYGRPGYERYYNNYQRRLNNRMRTDKGGLWAKPFMMSATQDKVDNMSGYDFNAYGLTAGVDRRLGALSIGLMGMYATGDMEQENKVVQSDLTTYGFGVYGSYAPSKSKTFMNFYALWSQTSNSAKHEVSSLGETAKADFDITTYSVGADMGYDVVISRNLTITPKIGIDYTSVQMDDVIEKGIGSSLLHVKADDLQSIQTPVEIRAAFDFGNAANRFKPEVHVRWTHEFGDTATQGDAQFVNYATPFTVEGLNVDTDTFTVGGSLLWLYNSSELQLKYDYDFSSTATGHYLNVGYKYLF